ncbi:MAG: YraN family protein [Ilumatobacter sp.]|uniref:YraN family protein n=1 Tax=Ilumatobacter sp. TaxID=1967498 RepID=UPI002633A8F6|nr:YraN family protein [Ilumatobacter sp.]MDJ0768257.1 YraN family protein [Ilumatobacter sp.]
MNDRSRQARGRWGEDRAVRMLERAGHRVLDRNWRSPEREVGGELDIVSVDGAVVVFCEVKARRRAGHGGALAAVDDGKQDRIRRLAESWLRLHRRHDVDVRFDVVTVVGVTLEHHRSVF